MIDGDSCVVDDPYDFTRNVLIFFWEEAEMVDDPYDFDWSGPRFYICHQHLPILETVVGLDGLERFCGICMVSSYQISSLKEQSEINFLMNVLSWHCRGIKQVIKGEYARRRECPRQPIKSTYKRNHFCHVIYV